MISEELYRNILLATVCVFATTWLLLFNLTASLLVLGCVVLTLVNVGGFIHFWGLTIDTVSCTNIISAPSTFWVPPLADWCFLNT